MAWRIAPSQPVQHCAVASPLRMVAYWCPQTGEDYQFLTKHFGAAATTIAAIYQDRWQVELFFKAIRYESLPRQITGAGIQRA